MADSRMNKAIQQLRSVAFLCDGAEPTDGQLLEAFLSRRDAAALTAIVSRHAPMVWGVCRRILRNDHDAEDAFQAAFLVLVRRAASIASRDLLANWLYAVACQTARKARSTAARRRTREKQVAQMPEPSVDTNEPQLDLRSLLDQELSNLGDKYRALIVLCDLEGKTRAEAAHELGCPEGTVAGRLARAREMLAKRLARRGVMASSAALAAAVAQEGAACAPAAVLSSTIKAACLVAAEPAAISAAVTPSVAALTEGVLHTMVISRLKTLTMVILTVGFLLGAAGWIGLQLVAGDRPNADVLLQAELKGFGEVIVTTPLKLKVTEGKDAKKPGVIGTWKATLSEKKDRVEFGVFTFSDDGKFTLEREHFLDLAMGTYTVDGDAFKITVTSAADGAPLNKGLWPVKVKSFSENEIVWELKGDDATTLVHFARVPVPEGAWRAVEEDRKKLQGGWEYVGTEKDGKLVKNKESAGTITFKGEKILEAGSKEYGIFTLSANRKLKAIQFRFSNGQGLANLGAYELDVDTLRICQDPERYFPAEFKTKGTKNLIDEYKRVKK
jgi:RNA polymerase sigma factor (sigma-70 family)